MAEARFVEAGPELDALAPAWAALPARWPDNPLFLHPAWLRAWQLQFAQHATSGVMAVEADGRLTGVMPVMYARVRRGPTMMPRYDYLPGDEAFLSVRPRYRLIPVRQLSPVLGLACTNVRGGLAAASADRAACIAAILYRFADKSGFDIALFPLPHSDLPAWQRGLKATGLAALFHPKVRSLYARSSLMTWDAYLQERGRHYRKRAKQSERYIAEAGLRLEIAEGQPAVQEGLEALARCASLSWKVVGREGEPCIVPYTRKQRAFVEALCRADPVDVIPLFYHLRDSVGVVRAGMLSFLCRRTLVPFLTFYDPEIARLGPGRFMIKGLFDFSNGDGAGRFDTIDFNATHPWVERFVEHVETYHHLLVFAPGPYGFVLRQLARRAGAVPPSQMDTIAADEPLRLPENAEGWA